MLKESLLRLSESPTAKRVLYVLRASDAIARLKAHRLHREAKIVAVETPSWWSWRPPTA